MLCAVPSAARVFPPPAAARHGPGQLPACPVQVDRVKNAARSPSSTAQAEVATDHASSDRGNGLASVGESTAAWLSYLHEVCGLLWPAPAMVAIQPSRLGWPRPLGTTYRAADLRTHPAGADFVLVPGLGRPPLLVPAKRRVAAAAVRHYSGPRSSATRLTARALSLGLARGLGGTMLRGKIRVEVPPGADTIEAYLQDVLSRDIQLSMYLGPARANRKPVLQLLSPQGQAVGFAKIGVSPLTRGLVAAERATLSLLAGARLAEVTVPPVLHYGEWHGLNVLVLGPLPVWHRHRSASWPRLAIAMSEVARVAGLQQQPLADSAYLRHLQGRLVAADSGPERSALVQTIDALAGRLGHVNLSFGAWHGDWAPWNMADTDGGLLVWDWERFTTGVPLGFDALHHWLQTEVGPRHRDPLSSASACISHAPTLLAPFSVEAAQARVTSLLYLADLATRYLVDRQAKAGARHGAPGTWLIPALTAGTTQL